MDQEPEVSKKDRVELEVLCDMCDGEYTGNWIEPCKCNGLGYIPTPLGEEVLTLVRRHFPRMLKRQMNGG